jgi:hypothetical protein
MTGYDRAIFRHILKLPEDFWEQRKIPNIPVAQKMLNHERLALMKSHLEEYSQYAREEQALLRRKILLEIGPKSPAYGRLIDFLADIRLDMELKKEMRLDRKGFLSPSFHRLTGERLVNLTREKNIMSGFHDAEKDVRRSLLSVYAGIRQEHQAAQKRMKTGIAFSAAVEHHKKAIHMVPALTHQSKERTPSKNNGHSF